MTTFAWDYENRLTSVTLPGSGGMVSFKYDPTGRRVYKSSSSGTSIFAYDGDNLVEETNGSGAVVARYMQTINIDEPLAMLRSSTTSYYDADGLGSITSLSSSAGSLAQTYGYDSFGKQTSSSGSLTNPFEYTARESDPETGLYYYRARYYDNCIGRFLNEDPVSFAGGIDFYQYVGNNPMLRKDPHGLWQFSIGGGAEIGVLVTFGHNSGQWNFGVYGGVGLGGTFSYDPTDSGCKKGGVTEGWKTDTAMGLGVGDYASFGMEGNINENGFSGEINANANFPGIGSLRWSPTKPGEPPHGVLSAGVTGFAGVGATAYSSAPCGCAVE